MGVVVYKGEGDTFERAVVNSRKINSFISAGWRITKDIEEVPAVVVVDEQTDAEKDPIGTRVLERKNKAKNKTK